MRRPHLDRYALAALPPWARIQGCCYPHKRALKARAREAMRARDRAAVDALRHGADPDAIGWTVRVREVADRWAFD